ncbi:MAG: MoxR family ATPase [Oscillospiraceae bacterium]|nr:MoxR family ATPase [Oscillospiraceae bacterium]
MNVTISKLCENIEKVIVGKREVIVNVIAAMLCEGHILIEDVPGVGKTQLVSALAKSVDGKFNRIQLTPDIMPSDIVGFSMLDKDTGEFQYRSGAAMCNFLLADEINRASPKAQSSLLEVMEEHQISLDGKTFILPKPFMTLATQNPVETYGTYHLPEAQMDRFIIKISIGYPTKQDELEILSRSEGNVVASALTGVCSTDDIVALQEQVIKVTVSAQVRDYILNIVTATRNNEFIKLGASPRGSIALLKMAKAVAFIDDRDYVTPDDVKKIMSSVLAHRIILSPKGKSKFETAEQAVEYVASFVAVPIA